MKEMNLPIVAILALAAGVASVEILTECPPYDPAGTTVHLPHKDCTKFYTCFMGKKYEMDCNLDGGGNKLYFNPALQICDYRWNVTCQNDLSEKCPPGWIFDHNKLVCDKPVSAESNEWICNPGLRTPHECHCNEYYECSTDGTSQILRTCPIGYYYDYDKKVCVVSSLAKCWRGQCTPDEKLPHEYDCSKYYTCGANGKKVIFQICNNGLLFDCDKKMCVPPQDIGRCCVVIPPHTFRRQDQFLEDVL